MKTLAAATVTLLFLSAAPAFAMSCCGEGGKSKAAIMCGKGSMATSHAGMRGKKSCCCEGMGANMSKRG